MLLYLISNILKFTQFFKFIMVKNIQNIFKKITVLVMEDTVKKIKSNKSKTLIKKILLIHSNL